MPNNLDELEADVRRASAWLDETEQQYMHAFEKLKHARRALVSAKLATIALPDEKVAA